MPPRMLRVNQIEVTNVIDNPPVGFLRHIEIEAAVPCFHVIQRDLHSTSHNSRQCAIGITKDHHRVGLFGTHHLFAFNQRTA